MKARAARTKFTYRSSIVHARLLYLATFIPRRDRSQLLPSILTFFSRHRGRCSSTRIPQSAPRSREALACQFARPFSKHSTHRRHAHRSYHNTKASGTTILSRTDHNGRTSRTSRVSQRAVGRRARSDAYVSTWGQ